MWTPPGGTLGRILEATRQRVGLLGGYEVTEPSPADPRPTLRGALRRDSVAVIGEVKRRSPSKGALRAELDAGRWAYEMERGGAAAVSVLTEPAYFGGALDDLVDVRQAVRVPVLRKDFHIDPLQLVEARRAGASAVLLIARALPPAQLTALIRRAEELGLEAVVEARTEAELECALDAGAHIVGINSRDLETLEVDGSVPERLMPLVPPDVIGVWESGVHDAAAVRRAAACGADAVLVGSALSKADEPAAFVRSLASVPRQARRG